MQKILTVGLSIFCHLSLAAEPTSLPSPTEAAATAGAPIYDQWYAVAAGASVVSAYHERLEDRGGKLYFQVRTWRKEGDQITEESVGGLSSGDKALTPQFFNLHSASNGVETQIDASFQGRLMIAKVKVGGTAKPPIRKTVPAGTILSNFFPVWIKSQFETLKPGKAVPFSALLEDGYSKGFPILPGTIQKEMPDTFAHEKRATKLTIQFAGMKNTWWVDEKGSAVRIEIPSAQLRVERVTQAQADEFLKAIGSHK